MTMTMMIMMMAMAITVMMTMMTAMVMASACRVASRLDGWRPPFKSHDFTRLHTTSHKCESPPSRAPPTTQLLLLLGQLRARYKARRMVYLL